MGSFRLRYDFKIAQSSVAVSYGDIATLLAAKSGDAGDDNIIMLWEAVRLKEVHLWGPAVTNSLNNQIGIEFTPQIATNSAPSENQAFIPGVNTIRTNDSTTSNTGSSHIVKRPTGLAASWINAATIMNPSLQSYNAAGLQPMFYLTGPQFSVLDLVVEFVESDGSYPVTYSSTEVTALGAGTYAAGLAFQGGASQILPQDFNVYD